MLVVALGAGSAWALHKESPGAYRITRGGSHTHPVTRSWGNWFAFSSIEDLTGTGNNRREIFVFNLGHFDCFNGTTFPTTPCPSPLPPFLLQATNGPGEPDNPSLAMPFDNSRPTDGIDDVQWLAFDALGNFSGGTGVQATHRQIFLKNLISNEIRQITFGTDGDSTRPNLGSLGGLITFESTARLTTDPTPAGIPQIYVYETNSRTLRQITHGNGPSTSPIPNNGGGLIAFQSTADLLGSGADTGVSQIYWAEYDKPTHTATLHRLTNGNAPSEHPYITEVNSIIVFDSSATDLLGTLGGGQAIYMSTPLNAASPQPPTLRQLTNPADFGSCSWPTVDSGSIADHISFVCDGDPLANLTTGNRIFTLELSTLTLMQLTGTGDVQPPISGSLGGWFITLSTTSDLTGQGSCGYQLHFLDYLPEKWGPATQRGQLPPDALQQSGGGTTLIGLRVMKVLPGDGVVGSRVSLTTVDGATVTGPPSGGALRLVIGAPDEFTGEAPVRLDHVNSTLPPITVPGWGVACLDLPADGQGIIDCDGGSASDYQVVQDHMVDDTNPSCLAPDCREDGACHPVLHGPHRTFCPICSSGGTGLGTCMGGPNAGQPCTEDDQCGPLDCVDGTVATCNGAIAVTPGGSAPPGTMLLTVPAELSISTNAGGDGKRCSGDDIYTAVRSVPVSLRFTTSSVSGAILDRDATAGATLTVADEGAPFDCARLRANDLAGARLAAVVPLLDVPNVPVLRDVLLNLDLQAAPPDLGCSVTGCVTSGDCNDGNACNGAETCVDGVCFPGTPFVCDDQDPCNGVETCDPGTGGCVSGPPCDDGDLCNGVETCDLVNGCQPGTPLPPCTDNDACNGVETCNPADGTCVPGTPLVCDDGNPCTADSCDAALGCVNAAIAGPCDDADACTTGDTCIGGSCIGIGTLCDDGNACNGTESCNPSTGLCEAGTPPACDDGNPCTNEVCDNAFGCLYSNVTGPCDDGSACTTGDICVAGACTGVPVVCDDNDVCNGAETCDPGTGSCLPGTNLDCNDNNVCTTDTCDALLGCLYSPAFGPCDDGSPCTTGDTCAAGVCVGTPVVCTDNDICNGVETCNPDGNCQPGTPLTCDDGNACTDDTCDALLGCLYTPNTDPCDDGSACTTGDVCTAGLCLGAPVVCTDGDVCNGDETCNPLTGACETGVPLNCDDGDACTLDSCDAVLGCLYQADPLCLAVSLVFTTSGAEPSALGGPLRQQQLVSQVTAVRRIIEKAYRSPKRARRAYRRAYRVLVKFQRKLRKGMQRQNFDLAVSNELLARSDMLMKELQHLMAGSK
jgi:hypothetical protein